MRIIRTNAATQFKFLDKVEEVIRRKTDTERDQFNDNYEQAVQDTMTEIGILFVSFMNEEVAS